MRIPGTSVRALALAWLIACHASAAEFEVPALRSAVTDQAGILSPTTRQQLESALRQLQSVGGTQLAVLTVPDLLENNFGRPAALAAAGMMFIMTVPAAYVLMLGVLLNFATGWPLWVGVTLGTALSVGYVYRGGLRAVVKSNRIVRESTSRFTRFRPAGGVPLCSSCTAGTTSRCSTCCTNCTSCTTWTPPQSPCAPPRPRRCGRTRSGAAPAPISGSRFDLHRLFCARPGLRRLHPTSKCASLCRFKCCFLSDRHNTMDKLQFLLSSFGHD